MKFFSTLRALGALLLLFDLMPWASAQNTLPLDRIFYDKDESGLEAVKNEANGQRTGTPFHKSNGVETLWYEGYFRPTSNKSKISLLSDDGATVWIDGQKVLVRARKGQGFEDFNSTFYPISKSFTAGQVYHLKLQYTNVYHTNDADVDGISVWAYDGGGEIVTLGVTITASKTNICAGAISDAVHQSEVVATVKDDSNRVVPNIPVTFTVENSHSQYPSTLSAATVSTTALGEAKTTLTSSQKISATATVKAKVANVEAVSPLITMEDAAETWSVNPDVLIADGESQAAVSLVLKHQQQAVASHQLSWRINKIWNENEVQVYDAAAGTGSAEGYGFLTAVTPTTDFNGFSSATYTFGTEVGKIEFAALDYTMVANSPRVRVNTGNLKVDTF